MIRFNFNAEIFVSLYEISLFLLSYLNHGLTEPFINILLASDPWPLDALCAMRHAPYRRPARHRITDTTKLLYGER